MYTVLNSEVLRDANTQRKRDSERKLRKGIERSVRFSVFGKSFETVFEF